MSEEDEIIFEIGDKLLLLYPLQGANRKWKKVKVVGRKRCKEQKNGSSFKYTLEFYKDPEEELIETRLLHLEWKRPEKDNSDDMAPKEKKRKHDSKEKQKKSDADDAPSSSAVVESVPRPLKKKRGDSIGNIPMSAIRYILAPMVGASELPFRILCRRYGATIAYTPMMLSSRFAVDEAYRAEEFQTCAEDRPLVAHFAANDPEAFVASALIVQSQCDAIDLNLGCPQRVAHAGHFGSFLLDEADRPLVLRLVSAIARHPQIKVPMFVKIRLLSTVEETIQLCRQLIEAGAALIAIHARHRVSLVNRSGPTARDGPALLDQVKVIRQTLHKLHHTEGLRIVPIIANGNIRNWQDIQDNLAFTEAEGVMSAEGILDNPAVFHRGQVVDKLQLAEEYLQLVEQYPTKLKSVVFHTRRMCRAELERYQLLQECINAASVDVVREIVKKMVGYRDRNDFVYDPLKEQREKEAEARRKVEEGRRKEFEARMVRKAKREGKPTDFYLLQGAAIPTIAELQEMRQLVAEGKKDVAFARWKEQHGQHCWAYHLETTKCTRDRTCPFLHAEATVTREACTASNPTGKPTEMEVYG